jgi:DNA-binding protein HU-beta
MNKGELVDAIASRVGDNLSKADAERALNAFIDVVQEEVAKGGQISLPGFGSFKRTERSARTGRNPQTGQPVQIPASKAPKFTAGAKFKEIVNK